MMNLVNPEISVTCAVNLPNALTLLRIFIVPLLVVVLLTPFSENWLGVPRHLLGVLLFLGAALTDYFDGHIARSRGQVTRLGSTTRSDCRQATHLRGADLAGRESARAGVGGRDHHRAGVCGYGFAFDCGG